MLFHHNVVLSFVKKNYPNKKKYTMYTISDNFAEHPVGISAGEEFFHPVDAKTVLLQTIKFWQNTLWHC
jgi:hypothetical protein